jgi:hypothetical protein
VALALFGYAGCSGPTPNALITINNVPSDAACVVLRLTFDGIVGTPSGVCAPPNGFGSQTSVDVILPSTITQPHVLSADVSAYDARHCSGCFGTGCPLAEAQKDAQFSGRDTELTLSLGGAQCAAADLSVPNDLESSDLQPCSVLPQRGCGSFQACDFVGDASIPTCRSATTNANETSLCIDDTDCAPGFTCVPNFFSADLGSSCRRFCRSTSDCLPAGYCFHDPGAIGSCTEGCNVLSQTGCPTPWGCVYFNDPTGTVQGTYCVPQGNVGQGGSCLSPAACRRGFDCLFSGSVEDGGSCAAYCSGAVPCAAGSCSNGFNLADMAFGFCP